MVDLPIKSLRVSSWAQSNFTLTSDVIRIVFVYVMCEAWIGGTCSLLWSPPSWP